MDATTAESPDIHVKYITTRASQCLLNTGSATKARGTRSKKPRSRQKEGGERGEKRGGVAGKISE